MALNRTTNAKKHVRYAQRLLFLHTGLALPSRKESELAKNIIHLGEKGYGSDHLIKARKDYLCEWCQKNIRKGELYARHSKNKFKVPMYPVCRDCAWWLR